MALKLAELPVRHTLALGLVLQNLLKFLVVEVMI